MKHSITSARQSFANEPLLPAITLTHNRVEG